MLESAYDQLMRTAYILLFHKLSQNMNFENIHK